jgi:hypothetical protein
MFTLPASKVSTPRTVVRRNRSRVPLRVLDPLPTIPVAVFDCELTTLATHKPVAEFKRHIVTIDSRTVAALTLGDIKNPVEFKVFVVLASQTEPV